MGQGEKRTDRQRRRQGSDLQSHRQNQGQTGRQGRRHRKTEEELGNPRRKNGRQVEDGNHCRERHHHRNQGSGNAPQGQVTLRGFFLARPGGRSPGRVVLRTILICRENLPNRKSSLSKSKRILPTSSITCPIKATSSARLSWRNSARSEERRVGKGKTSRL